MYRYTFDQLFSLDHFCQGLEYADPSAELPHYIFDRLMILVGNIWKYAIFIEIYNNSYNWIFFSAFSIDNSIISFCAVCSDLFSWTIYS